jgi:alkanesulfonate monooxygenase SsuD/methylene tetrahydromethanopterin reductase-like flavin-dependent oxidoreductase (luciferase family)
MEVGIGLPTTIRGVERDQTLEWARRAEARGFSSLGTIDRIVYDNYDPLIALAAAAAVTERIRLATTILIVPYRANGVLVAKQAASVDRISNGRLVLGVAVGGREDDYIASGVDFHARGRIFDQMLQQWHDVWAGESFGTAGAVGPRPPRERPRVMVGGAVDKAFERAARYGDGWIMGGGSPDQFAERAPKARAAWEAAGREGEPRLMALGYYALGDRAEQAANDYLRDYYAFTGEYAGMIADSAAKDADTVGRYVQGFSDAGCDELVLFPCDPDPGQVDLLADAIA